MVKKDAYGEVHAPVEDTDIPPTLKLLVVVISLVVIGLIAFLVYSSYLVGVFAIPLAP